MVMEQDIKNMYLSMIYVFMAIAFLVDIIFYGDSLEALEWGQIVAFGLIVAPNMIIILLRLLNLIK